MKLFIHEGSGHYIGSVIIVRAGSKKTANTLIREELDNIGLPNEELNVEELIFPTKKPTVLYRDNGDY